MASAGLTRSVPPGYRSGRRISGPAQRCHLTRPMGLATAPATPALDRRDLSAAAATVLVALVLRTVWHLAVPVTDWPDTAIYAATGQALLQSGRMSSPIYMPGYPLLLALAGPDGVIRVQIVLSALTAGLVQILALTLFGRRAAAMAAGAIAAVYPLLIFYAAMRLSETVFIFLLTAAVVAGLRRHAVSAAALLVLAILVRPTIDFVAPLVMLSFFLPAQGWPAPRWWPALRPLAIYAVVYGVLMTPWWLHNHAAYGRWVRLNLGDGIVMVLENNPVFERVGLDFTALAPAWAPFDGIKDPAARNDAMKSAAWAYIAADPLRYLAGCLDRLARFWSPTPLSPKPAVNLLGFATTFPV